MVSETTVLLLWIITERKEREIIFYPTRCCKLGSGLGPAYAMTGISANFSTCLLSTAGQRKVKQVG